VQTVVVKDNTAAFEIAKDLTSESNIRVVGTVKAEPKAKGGVEIEIDSIEVLAHADSELPLAVYEKNPETAATVPTRLQHRFLDLRRPENALIIKVQSAFDKYYREFLDNQGFLELHTPKLMPTPSESTNELFKLDYFGNTAYLAQSPQLYKQMAIAAGLEKVFEIGAIYRAEKSYTTRHTTEAISYDIEMAYVESPEDLMALAEKMMVYILENIKKDLGEEIQKTFGIEIKIPALPFPRVPLAEVKKLVGSEDVDDDLSSEEERKLGEIFSAKDQDFVFVTEYPKMVRAFYHKWSGGDKISNSADLIYKGIEIATIAQREENYEELVRHLKVKKMNQEGLQWYLDFFKYGTPPHGGWGMGGARVVKQLLNIPSIHEVMFIQRAPNKMFP
jgi:aspartyl-tRNA synthetase